MLTFEQPMLQKHSEETIEVLRKLKVIKIPKGEAGEYWSLVVNPYNRFGGIDSHELPGTLKPGFLDLLRKDLEKLRKNNIKGLLIGLCSTSDPWGAGEQTIYTRKVIDIIHADDHFVNTLTKSHVGIVDKEHFRQGDMYGATITTLDDEKDMNNVEAFSPLANKLMLLRFSTILGSKNVWVNVDPVISPDDALYVISDLWRNVGTFNVGKLNHEKTETYLGLFCEKLKELSKRIDSTIYIKRSLQKYMEVAK